MNLFEQILARYRANRKLGNLALALALALALHYFPWIIDWMPDGAKHTIQTAVAVFLGGAAQMIAAWFSKQHDTSGTGTLSDPYTKPDATGGTKVVQ